MTRTPLAKERDVQKLITDWLSAQKIWYERRNTGAFKGEHNGRSRFVRFSRPDTADIMAVRITSGRSKAMIANDCPEMLFPMTYWIEIKSSTGKQSPEQKAFQAEVEAQGMKYILARSLDDVTAVLA